MQQAQDNVLVGIAEPINDQGENLLIDHFLGYASHELEPQEIDKVIGKKKNVAIYRISFNEITNSEQHACTERSRSVTVNKII